MSEMTEGRYEDLPDSEKLKFRIKHVVTLSHYRNGEVWYVCADGFKFPVQVPADVGDAELKATERGGSMMKFIKRQMKLIESSKQAQNDRCAKTACPTPWEGVALVELNPNERMKMCSNCRHEHGFIV